MAKRRLANRGRLALGLLLSYSGKRLLVSVGQKKQTGLRLNQSIRSLDRRSSMNRTTMTLESEDSVHFQRGVNLLHDPVRNKGTAFSDEERDQLGLRGLLPPRVNSLETQVKRVMENLRRKTSDLERYIFLVALQDRNETLFYRLLLDHLEEIMPLIYTPTVGKACQLFGHIYRRPRGLYISSQDRGRIRKVLENWPHREARVIVVTDGERILGLGDLGANGMGIPIGKLALYSTCAGIHPTQCLPITLDVGTENATLLNDPLYIGLPHRRLEQPLYDELVEEFIDSVLEIFPGALVQLEDFANRNAFRLLETYRHRLCLFDDDIQGTGSVVLAGMLAALPEMGGKLSEKRFLFLGAGEAGIGIASLLVTALQQAGLSRKEARRRCWFVDRGGLVVKDRPGLSPQKREFAQDHPPLEDLLDIVKAIKPAALIGVCGMPGTFTKPVLECLAELNERPLILALSNPTHKSECTARQAYTWTRGRGIFASGSPFGSVDLADRTFVPGQANNAYVFPGVGLGAVCCQACSITDEMFLVAAQTLAKQVTEKDLKLGRIYPPLSKVREVSLEIAVSVAQTAYASGMAKREEPKDLREFIRSQMFEPVYPDLAG